MIKGVFYPLSAPVAGINIQMRHSLWGEGIYLSLQIQGKLCQMAEEATPIHKSKHRDTTKQPAPQASTTSA